MTNDSTRVEIKDYENFIRLLASLPAALDLVKRLEEELARAPGRLPYWLIPIHQEPIDGLYEIVRELSETARARQAFVESNPGVVDQPK